MADTDVDTTEATEATNRAAVLELLSGMGRLTASWEQAFVVVGDDLAGLAGELTRLAAGARVLNDRLALGPVSRLVLRPDELHPPAD